MIAAVANPYRDRRPRKRPAKKGVGDQLGRVRHAPGVDYRAAIEAARGLPWWPRVRSESPTLSAGYWCWPLRGQA